MLDRSNRIRKKKQNSVCDFLLAVFVVVVLACHTPFSFVESFAQRVYAIPIKAHLICICGVCVFTCMHPSHTKYKMHTCSEQRVQNRSAGFGSIPRMVANCPSCCRKISCCSFVIVTSSHIWGGYNKITKQICSNSAYSIGVGNQFITFGNDTVDFWTKRF